jgi:hypothetical protein
MSLRFSLEPLRRNAFAAHRAGAFVAFARRAV